ncbi:MAG: hypothetical protein WBF93_02450 [Pirellulales bacterium]|nr:hypothetical protein [Pirellulales bacterium]
MSTSRSALLTKSHKVLKKYFEPVVPNLRLPVLDQLILACCLEDASAKDAQRAFDAVQEQFFDWNEVRVSSVKELSEVMQMLAFPQEAANRLKGTLQSVFEANYSFDLEKLKKENIGVAIKKITKYGGVTPFVVSFVTQTALGGHAIPVSRGGLESLYILGVINEKEKNSYTVPGLERAISKNKGVEFGSLLNQLGGQLRRFPYGASTRKILLDIAPDCKDRLPKRVTKAELEKQEAEIAEQAEKARAAKKSEQAKASDRAAKAKAAKKPVKVKMIKVVVKKKVVAKKKASAVKKKTAKTARVKKKKTVKKKTASKRAGHRKPR